MIDLPYIKARKVEIRDERLDCSLMVVIIELEAEGRVWVEQFTDVMDVQHFLQGVKASFTMIGLHVEVPLIGVYPGGAVQIENPPKNYWCARCKKKLARKVEDVQGWDGACNNCGPIPQTAVLEKRPT